MGGFSRLQKDQTSHVDELIRRFKPTLAEVNFAMDTGCSDEWLYVAFLSSEIQSL